MDLQQELLQLLQKLCDERLTESEVMRLNQLLEDPKARRIYLHFVDMHAQLLTPAISDEWPSPWPSRVRELMVLGIDSRSNQNWTPTTITRLVLLIAPVALLLFGSLLWLFKSVNGPQGNRVATTFRSQTDAYIATISQLENAVLMADHMGYREGSRVVAGRFELRQGIVRLTFESGASLLVEGPATLELESNASAKLLLGKVVVRGDDASSPFIVETPRATYTDIGTEYGLMVQPVAETILVFSGIVERKEGTSSVVESLASGQSRQYGDIASSSDSEAPAQAVFVRQLKRDLHDFRSDDLLAYEPFQYGSRTALRDGTAEGGEGFVGPWVGGFARLPQQDIDDQAALNVDRNLRRDHVPDGSSGCFQHTGFAKYFRRLARPIRLDADGVYYFAFLINRSGPRLDPLNAIAVQLRESEELDQDLRLGNMNLRKRLNFGIDRTSDLFTHLQRKGTRIPLPLSMGATYLLIAKVVASQNHADQVFLRLYGPDEAVDTSEPTIWSASGQPIRSDLVFDWLEIHINGQSEQALDEIRVGTSWLAVASEWLTP